MNTNDYFQGPDKPVIQNRWSVEPIRGWIVWNWRTGTWDHFDKQLSEDGKSSAPIKLSFANQFGTLTLVLISDVRPIDSIFGTNIADEHKFGLNIAEQVALITENRRVQIGGLGAHDCYIVVHESPNMAAIARIEAINYVGGIPSQEIKRARRDLA